MASVSASVPVSETTCAADLDIANNAVNAANDAVNAANDNILKIDHAVHDAFLVLSNCESDYKLARDALRVAFFEDVFDTTTAHNNVLKAYRAVQAAALVLSNLEADYNAARAALRDATFALIRRRCDHADAITDAFKLKLHC